MPITWNSNLVTGIRQIDLQHQELIELINELESAHNSGQDAVALADVLPRLKSYIFFHFNEEETITSRVADGMDHFERHIAEHRQFTDLISKLKFDQPEKVSQAVDDLVSYLQVWLIEHIMKTDMQLAAIYHARRRARKAQ